MAEIELSVMSRGTTTVDDLTPLLVEFEAQSGVRVRLRVMEWGTAWAELVKVALYQHGPDVSEIGSTWLGSFVGMHALEQFSDAESAALGGADTFVPSIWASGELGRHPLERPVRWGIPWWADTRLLFFRRDLLAQAGIDGKTAFESFERLEQTLSRLLEAGIPMPWVVPTHQSRMTVHNLASWLWGSGGHFLSGDGARALFSWPEAQAGMRAYFGLARFLTRAARDLDDTESDGLFIEGRAAATISGPWLRQFVGPEVMSNLGVTLPPGIPFVGGSQLVCWRHTAHAKATLELVQFLTSQHVQSAFGQHAGLLPTRWDVLCEPPFSDDPLYQVVAQGLERGRSFRANTLWGLVEDQLNATFSQLWADILADPDLDLKQTIAAYVESLARQLDITLQNRR